MKVTIKITDGKTWNDEMPLEFNFDEARKLWIELSKIFKTNKNEDISDLIKKIHDESQGIGIKL